MTVAKRMAAVRAAARAYRLNAARLRRARQAGSQYGVSVWTAESEEIKAKIQALRSGASAWTDRDGVTRNWIGLVVGSEMPKPGVWFGGAGF